MGERASAWSVDQEEVDVGEAELFEVRLDVLERQLGRAHTRDLMQDQDQRCKHRVSEQRSISGGQSVGSEQCQRQRQPAAASRLTVLALEVRKISPRGTLVLCTAAPTCGWLS